MRYTILFTLVFLNNISTLWSCGRYIQKQPETSFQAYADLRNYLQGKRPPGRKPIYLLQTNSDESKEVEILVGALARIYKHEFHRFDSKSLNLIPENVSQFVTGKKRVIFASLDSETNYTALDRLRHMNEIAFSDNNIIVVSMSESTQQLFQKKITFIPFMRSSEIIISKEILSDRYEIIEFDGKQFELGVRIFDWNEYFEIKHELPSHYEGYPVVYQVILRE